MLMQRYRGLWLLERGGVREGERRSEPDRLSFVAENARVSQERKRSLLPGLTLGTYSIVMSGTTGA